MGDLFPASSLLSVVVLLCALSCGASVIFDNPVEQCKGAQTNGFVADENDKTVYYYCLTSGSGVKITCTPSGYQWNKELQVCVPEAYNKATEFCSALPTVQHGEWDCKDPLSIAKKCTLTCSEGYELKDLAKPLGQQNLGNSKSWTCKRMSGSSAGWGKDLTQLKCASVCDPNPCGYGTCAVTGGKAVCTCADGWTTQTGTSGDPCLKAINFCRGKKLQQRILHKRSNGGGLQVQRRIQRRRLQ